MKTLCVEFWEYITVLEEGHDQMKFRLGNFGEKFTL